MAVLFAGPVGTLAQGSPPAVAPPAAVGDRDAFIAGETVNCPGCDLSELSFKRRDLTNADLSDADLEGTSFHASILRGANFSRLERPGWGQTVDPLGVPSPAPAPRAEDFAWLQSLGFNLIVAC